MTIDKTETSALGKVRNLADQAIHNKFVDAAVVVTGAVVACKTGLFGRALERGMEFFPRADALMTQVDSMLLKRAGGTSADEALSARLKGAVEGFQPGSVFQPIKTPASTPIDYTLDRIRATVNAVWQTGTAPQFAELGDHSPIALEAYTDAKGFIHPSAYIHESAVIAPNARVHEGAFVGDGAVIDSGAVIGKHAHVGERALVGEFSIIGNRAFVGHDANIGHHVVVNDFAAVHEFAAVDDNGVLGERSFILSHTKMGKGASLGIRAHVGKNGSIGDGVVIADGAGISRNVLIGNGAEIGAFGNVNGCAEIGAGAKVGSQALVMTASKVPDNFVVPPDTLFLKEDLAPGIFRRKRLVTRLVTK
jgi:UDP-3-O-[3-hydroxymyristoyl] glucosamine N-acyltransferase